MSEIRTEELRNQFKKIVGDELEKLPELLEQMEAKERLNFICRMIPYVLPKVDTVDYSRGEPDNFIYKEYELTK